MKRISIKEVLNHLENGVTRTTDSKMYNPELRSIEEIYELSKSDVREMFKHPLLMNKKTKPPRAFMLVDDTQETAQTLEAESTNVPVAMTYGARPASSTPSEADIPVNLSETQQATESEEVIAEEVSAEAQDTLA